MSVSDEETSSYEEEIETADKNQESDSAQEDEEEFEKNEEASPQVPKKKKDICGTCHTDRFVLNQGKVVLHTRVVDCVPCVDFKKCHHVAGHRDVQIQKAAAKKAAKQRAKARKDAESERAKEERRREREIKKEVTEKKAVEVAEKKKLKKKKKATARKATEERKELIFQAVDEFQQELAALDIPPDQVGNPELLSTLLDASDRAVNKVSGQASLDATKNFASLLFKKRKLDVEQPPTKESIRLEKCKWIPDSPMEALKAVDFSRVSSLDYVEALDTKLVELRKELAQRKIRLVTESVFDVPEISFNSKHFLSVPGTDSRREEVERLRSPGDLRLNRSRSWKHHK